MKSLRLDYIVTIYNNILVISTPRYNATEILTKYDYKYDEIYERTSEA